MDANRSHPLASQVIPWRIGITEHQLRRVVLDAKKQKGATGGKIVELLERRLDDLVFRGGFAQSIPAARPRNNTPLRLALITPSAARQHK